MSNESQQMCGPTSFELEHDAWGRLVLCDHSGHRLVDVQPVRCFPIADPQHWVSICDSQGHELVCIEDLDVLSRDVREVLDRDLATREFLPVVQRVIWATVDKEPAEWEVETDRGLARFLLNSEDDIRRLGPYRALIVDAHGTRFLVPDMRQMDAASRKVLERYL